MSDSFEAWNIGHQVQDGPDVVNIVLDFDSSYLHFDPNLPIYTKACNPVIARPKIRA